MSRIACCLVALTVLALPSALCAQTDAIDTRRFFLTLGIGGHSMNDSVMMEFGPEVFANFGYFVAGRVSVGAEFAMSGHSMNDDTTFNTSALAGHYVAVFNLTGNGVPLFFQPQTHRFIQICFFHMKMILP